MSLTSWTTEENTKHHDLVRSIGSVGSCDVVEIRPSDDAGGDEECNYNGQVNGICSYSSNVWCLLTNAKYWSINIE